MLKFDKIIFVSFTYSEKPSISRYIDVFWETHDRTDGTYLAPADGCWDMIFTTTQEGKTIVRLSGPSTTPTPVPYKKGNYNIGLRLKQGVFFTHLPVSEVVDRTEVLPMPSKNTFLLGGHVLDLPTYETFDSFVARIKAKDLLSEDPIVRAVLEGTKFGASQRSVQRRFGRVTGMTPAYITQIERAWQAVDLLKQGKAITAVADELGYSDQAHLNRHLKRITGFTPKQNAKRDEPLG